MKLGPPRSPGPPRKGLVYPVVGIEEGGGGSCHHSRIRRAAGARKLVKNPPYGVFRRRRPGGSSSQYLVAPSVATGLLAARAYSSPPGDVTCRRGGSLVSALHLCCSPTSLTPGTDISLISKKPSVHGFPAADDPPDLRRLTVPLLRLRPASVLRIFGPLPQGRPKGFAGLAAANERRALALRPSCPPPAPTPSSHR